MKKKTGVILCLIILISGLTLGISMLVFRLGDGAYPAADPGRDIEDQSPEYLARESGDLMIQALNGEISAEELFEKTAAFSASDKDELLKEKANFISSLEQSRTYFNQNGMEIEAILYSETEYLEEDWACIRRIHRYNTGKQYYFCQYFKRIDGNWKIVTDTMENKFVLKKKWLLWYVPV